MSRARASALAVTLLAGCASFPWPAGADGAAAPAALPGETLAWGQAPGSGTPPADPGYLIGPEDALEISVWKDDTLKSTALVRPDGAVSFPLVGDLQAAGRTAQQLRDELSTRLAKFIPDVVVSVAVVRVASYRVYVIGRVNKPGEIAAGRKVDVLQALSLAGGMTPFAADDEIRIIRRSEGRSLSIPFDYARIRKGGDLGQNITLQSGDVVLVP